MEHDFSSPRANGGIATKQGEFRAVPFPICRFDTGALLPLCLETCRKFWMKTFPLLLPHLPAYSLRGRGGKLAAALPVRGECGSQARLALILRICPWSLCSSKALWCPFITSPHPTPPPMCCVWTFWSQQKGW